LKLKENELIKLDSCNGDLKHVEGLQQSTTLRQTDYAEMIDRTDNTGRLTAEASPRSMQHLALPVKAIKNQLRQQARQTRSDY